MAEKEWIEIGTTIKGSYDTLDELIQEHPTGNDTDAYLVGGDFYFWNGSQWENAGGLKGETGPAGPKGDTSDKGDKGGYCEKGTKGDKGETGATGEQGERGPKGDTGDTRVTGDTGQAGETEDTGATGVGLTIKGSYNTYEELIHNHPTGNNGDSYLVNGLLYVWNGTAWENVETSKEKKVTLEIPEPQVHKVLKEALEKLEVKVTKAIKETLVILVFRVLKGILGQLVRLQMKTQDGNYQSMKY